jgi:hypothetical protein
MKKRKKRKRGRLRESKTKREEMEGGYFGVGGEVIRSVGKTNIEKEWLLVANTHDLSANHIHTRRKVLVMNEMRGKRKYEREKKEERGKEREEREERREEREEREVITVCADGMWMVPSGEERSKCD